MSATTSEFLRGERTVRSEFGHGRVDGMTTTTFYGDESPIASLTVGIVVDLTDGVEITRWVERDDRHDDGSLTTERVFLS